MVYSIVEDLNGDVEIESPIAELGHGTRVHLWLPSGTI
jgi:signal transduction histidine kinase